MQNDVCLLKFEEDLLAIEETARACLASEFPEAGQACWIAGWGFYEEDSGSSDILKSVGLNILSHEYCKEHAPASNMMTQNEICVGLPDSDDADDLTDGGSGACSGDSGGPLICNVDGFATVMGVASYTWPPCGSAGLPSIYASIAHDNWVEMVLKGNNAVEFDPVSDRIDETLTTCSDARSLEKIIEGTHLDSQGQAHWPWLARLAIGALDGGTCGGTIIDNHWVLTAAHCVEHTTTVFATFNDYSSVENENGEKTLEASQVEIHDDYFDDPNGLSFMDIALLKFDEDLLSLDGTAKACLATSYPEAGQACWVAGWGMPEDDHPVDSIPASTILKSVGLNVFSQEYCAQKAEFDLSTMLKSHDICVGIPDLDGDGEMETGESICMGDSGGPLICNVNGAATVMGVASGVWRPCGAKTLPSVYDWIAQDNWISQTIAANT
ncbi:Oidioi.mRNA.OKI2018_I69.PAR.g9818.t1.cds [Oikopleura dioica]|uniref:Oidioi.mRNA.OKI2018_I69.PAR.g9818.t1.cds n=1 Tax=Oikopleura dioica TaxID=34765 RepID=A0ABN7RTD3_OIKDI|nr:Oidioi.mRNA.OKI2018_I69.PAR.g9818.t1.cds [Oikopleura dioica]